MSGLLPGVAHCLAGHRPQPFIADPAVRLARYQSIVLARDHIHRACWGSTPIYEAQDRPGWVGPELIEPAPGFNDIPAAFVAAIDAHSVRLLHAHHGMFALEFMALRERVGLPLIASFYGFDASAFPRSSPENLARLRQLFASASLVTAMSQDMRRDLISWGCPEDRVAVSLPAVDTVRFSPPPFRPPSTTVNILCVSDFSAKKGVMTLLESVCRVSAHYPNARLHLVGVPTTIARGTHQEITRRVNQLGLSTVVSFDGWRDYPDVNESYHTADIFALASEQAPDGSKEGVPAVVLEAMASELPVVSTRHAGIPEVVVDGKTGWLVPERDVTQLSQALGILISSAQMRTAMGKAGRRRVENLFGLSAHVARLENLYDMVASKN